MRHGAMVPWDYDLDIALVKEDWDVLHKLIGKVRPFALDPSLPHLKRSRHCIFLLHIAMTYHSLRAFRSIYLLS